MADHIESYSAEQLEALAAKKRRAERADVVDIAEGRAPRPADAWPTETTLGSYTFHLHPGLSDDWDFGAMAMEFNDVSATGHGNLAEVAERIISYAYVEPYEDIMDALKTLHPEDERPHVHSTDVRALIEGTAPKAR